MNNTIITSSVAREFALKTFKLLNELDNLDAFRSILSIHKMNGTDAIYIKDKVLSINMPSLFISCSKAELNKRNKDSNRWFAEEIIIKGIAYHLTTQWTGERTGKNNKIYIYSIPKLKEIVERYYPNYSIQIEGTKYSLVKNRLLPDLPMSESSNVGEFKIDVIIDSIKSTGLLYDDNLIRRYVAALLTKPFVILSGLAGSGKTQLSLAFAHALCDNLDEQLCFVAVGADWTNREPLLGYPNALKSNEYVKPENGVLDIIIRASKKENKDKPYFLILDEMNLSYVERYFADFLSAMESNQEISLWTTNSSGIPMTVQLPKNLFIIGTINVDETTYMFSPKVLDRASVIEFKVSSEDMLKFLQEAKSIDRHAADRKASFMATDFVKKSFVKDIIKEEHTANILIEFFKVLKEVNAEFGYRSASEIYRYISFAKGLGMTDKEAIDSAIVQKLLPKLHGSRKRVMPVLEQLWKLCQEGLPEEKKSLDADSEVKIIYKLSADKIRRMRNAAIDNGFTSFAEA